MNPIRERSTCVSAHIRAIPLKASCLAARRFGILKEERSSITLGRVVLVLLENVGELLEVTFCDGGKVERREEEWREESIRHISQNVSLLLNRK